jgi:nitrite reductase/ring-hydroxylating ferredoxin subunit/putative sterol carrier protein
MAQSSTFVPATSAARARDARFPFAEHPKGWFAIGVSSDVEPTGVKTLRYFGCDLVLYRSASGKAFVTGAYCPHLGAHLGHGGKVDGETIQCPFHGWRFSGDGSCVQVPYCDKIPPKARLDALPVCELNGVIFAYWDPSGGRPTNLPQLDETGWTPGRVVVWRNLKTHVQEVFENTVDTAHIAPIHKGRGARIIGKPVLEGPVLRVDIEFEASGEIVGMPDQINDVLLQVTMRGLGWTLVETHVRNVDVRARQRIYVTPVDDETVDIRGIVHVRATDDAAFTEELSRLFYEAYVEDFAKDFPIWENKRYLERPQLAKGDGPIGLYRKWCKQFYSTVAEASSPNSNARSFLDMLEPARRRLAVVAESLASAVQRGRSSPVASAGAAQGDESRSSAPSRKGDGFRVETVAEYFETLEKRFVPAAATGVDAVFQWELGGEGGGTFHACVRDGSLSVHRGAHEKPTVALVMDASSYVRVVNGDLDGMRAFTTGGGKVKGSIGAAMKMRTLFPAHSPAA